MFPITCGNFDRAHPSVWTVWCWGWDGAGDLDGPDVDPIWERMPNKSTRADAVKVRHVRSLLYV